MVQKVTPLLLLMALLVLPVGAQSPASNIPLDLPQAGEMELPHPSPEPIAASCISNCISTFGCGDNEICLELAGQICFCQCKFGRPSC
jgi:hypothetical protein